MAVYGFRPVKIVGLTENNKVLMKASTTITKYDPITLEYHDAGNHGEADLAIGGEGIFGVAMETKTSTASGGEEIEILCGKDIVYEIDNDEDTNSFGATVGTGMGAGMVFDIQANPTTGTVLLDTSTGTAQITGASGQVVCINSEPDSADTSLGWFKINESQF